MQNKTAAYLYWRRASCGDDSYFTARQIKKHPRFKEESLRSVFASLTKLDRYHFLERIIVGTTQNPTYAYRLLPTKFSSVKLSFQVVTTSNLWASASALYAEDEIFDEHYWSTSEYK